MRLRLCCVLLSAVLVARAQTLGNNPHATGVEGTYELVSQETRLTKPQKSVIMRKSPDWSGLLQFHDGYYAWVLMKKTRPTYFESNQPEDLGFEATAGTYEAGDHSILLKSEYALHPFEVEISITMTYAIQGDMLTIIRTMTPGVEDIREGTIKTVSRRLR